MGMEYEIKLEKMSTFHEPVVRYELDSLTGPIKMNDLIGQQLTLSFTGEIYCTACDKKTKKSFNQGYCYPCFIKLAACDSCIMQPEKCHFEQGTCREPEWAQSHCMVPHYVYLANSSGIKVGITRNTQIPTRFMDQGATKALPILTVDSRFHSGLIEVELKNYIPDRTQWQKMLKGEESEVDLIEYKRDLISKIEPLLNKLKAKVIDDEKILEFKYPVEVYPTKVSSFNFDKEMNVSGKLNGIKGQYLIFDTGVINLRKFTGYKIKLNV